jgi:hypothetical protein
MLIERVASLEPVIEYFGTFEDDMGRFHKYADMPLKGDAENIPDRMKDALQHLVKLCGGNLTETF